jgi:antitoxin PrlF
MTITVSSKGQVAIPAPVRRRLGLNKGTQVDLRVEEGRVVLEKIRKKGWRSLRGIAKGSGALEYLEEHRREVARDECN